LNCGRGTVPAVAAAMDEVAFHKALGAIIDLVTKGNEYVQSMQPWALAKDPGKRAGWGRFSTTPSKRPGWPRC